MSEVTLGGQELVTPIAYGNHLHYAMFKHNSDGSIAKKLVNGRNIPIVLVGQPRCEMCEQENQAFDYLQDSMGADYLAKKIMKREQYRLFDRKFPYDSTAKAIPLEDVQDMLGDENTFLEEVIANEAIEAFLAVLTPKQRAVAELLLQGHKPATIAEQWGLKDSNSVRWHKHSVKQRAAVFFAEYNRED